MKHMHNFQPQWKQGRSLLCKETKGKNKIMICSVCRASKVVDYLFVTGMSLFRIDGIKKHWEDEAHKNAMLKHKASSEPGSQSEAAKCLLDLKNPQC